MNIAIWGCGVSGFSALKLLKSLGKDKIFVIQTGEPKTWANLNSILEYIPIENCVAESRASEFVGDIDEIIISPGISRAQNFVLEFINKGVPVISEIELAYRCSDIPIVGVTGSNGKTTTATLMAEALKRAGKKVFLGGNIGLPFCEMILSKENYDYGILELSSFQLESTPKFKPDIGVLLNVFENHMERYESVAEYYSAKLNLFKNMGPGGVAIIPESCSFESKELTVERILKSKNINLKNSKLVGDHNLENLFCVERVLNHLDIKNSTQIIQEVVDTFSGVKYRQEILGEIKGALFINDSKSTNTIATLAAVKSFQANSGPILILGGKLRADDQSFKKELEGLNIKHIHAFGEARYLVQRELSSSYALTLSETLKDVFSRLKLEPEDTVLFSPGFPSFDQFRNYIFRGEHFESLFREFLKKSGH